MTSRLTHDRISRLLMGIVILVGLALSIVTPWGYLIPAGLALNLVQFFFTGQCLIKDLLDRLGVPYEHPPEHLIVGRRKPAPVEELSSTASYAEAGDIT